MKHHATRAQLDVVLHSSQLNLHKSWLHWVAIPCTSALLLVGMSKTHPNIGPVNDNHARHLKFSKAVNY